MLELRLLGGLGLRRANVGGASDIALQSKRLVLLAYLATAPVHTPRRRDSLLALFWPDLDQEHARGALRQALHALRSTLGESVILTRGESEIAVDHSRILTDVGEFQAAVAAGTPGDALELYKGAFLDGVFVADCSPDLDEWIAAERARLARSAATAAWAVADSSCGGADAVDAVRRAMQLSGDDEISLRRGIALMDRVGDSPGAVALYNAFAQRVGMDLGVEPSAETQALVDAIRARRSAQPQQSRGPGDPVVATSPPADPSHLPTQDSGSPAPRWRRLLIAPALLSVALLAIVALRARVGGSRIVAADLVAITPFQVSSADSSVAWLEEGMIELLRIRLAGNGGMRVAEGRPADAVGAGWVIVGNVTGTKERLILSARLHSVSSGRTVASAASDGPSDSLQQLVDRLAIPLLGAVTDLDPDRVPSLATWSYPALRSFLAGRAAYRRGQSEEALMRFREAVTLDSNFAIAALELARLSAWVGTSAEGKLGLRLAMAGRDQLGQADRALLDAYAVEPQDTRQLFRVWNAAVTAYPNRPEIWYTLGDMWYHSGTLGGIPDALDRAVGAFRRGWLLDSATAGANGVNEPWVAEPIEHMVELAHLRGDTAEVRRLVGLVPMTDSTSYLPLTLAWHRAEVEGSAALDAYWSRIESAPQRTFMLIALFTSWTGVGIGDFPRIYAEDRRRLLAHDPRFAEFGLTMYALNRGRPGDVPRAGTFPAATTRPGRREYLRRALWWDGDTVGITDSLRAIEAGLREPPASAEAARALIHDLCAVGIWYAVRGDHGAASRGRARLMQLRSAGKAGADSTPLAGHAHLCEALIEATNATGLGSRDAHARLAEADSLARARIFSIHGEANLQEANLILARLWELQGNPALALDAVRRRGSWFGDAPIFMSTFVREEGRLALLNGDTVSAVRAWRHYLGLRYDPEPRLRPAAAEIRRELAALGQLLDPETPLH